MPADFPNLPRSQEAFTLYNASRIGGVTLGGTVQAVANPSGLWKARIGIRLRKVEHYLTLRGFLAGLDGQAGTFNIGPIDWRGQPWYRDSLLNTTITPGVAARSSAQDPGTGVNPDTAGNLSFSVAEDAPLNSTSIVINRLRGGFLQVGQYLQLGARLYTITGLLSPEFPDPHSGLPTPGNVRVTIRPWLKDMVPATTPINFVNPKGIMRLADAQAPDVEMTTSPLGDVTLNLIEA
jgi:hypothetical protein